MILIIDNGSQYTHLIKRNCRELGYEAEMLYFKADYAKVEEYLHSGVAKIILSGGPSSVYSDPSNLSSAICENVRGDRLRLPLLGICYGHQMVGHIWGAKVAKGKNAEYGLSDMRIDNIAENALFKNVPSKFRAWVSHFDEVKELPKDFVRLAHSDSCNIEAMRHKTLPVFGVQFHPEVWHTENGEIIMKNFLEVSV